MNQAILLIRSQIDADVKMCLNYLKNVSVVTRIDLTQLDQRIRRTTFPIDQTLERGHRFEQSFDLDLEEEIQCQRAGLMLAHSQRPPSG